MGWRAAIAGTQGGWLDRRQDQIGLEFIMSL